MMKSQITREAAWELLRKYNKDSFHLQHALTVEGVMRWYAEQLGFAAGCSREVIEQGAEMLGWPLDEVLQKTLDAMRDCEARVANGMEAL